MNTSQPVSSHLAGVNFGFLLPSDIRALSAKRITSALTFDTLLNPVPGGLYTPELGQFQDNSCATCGLKTPQCPGHCGHIELPVPCYHPTYMDQVLRLLRATCIYCHKLKLGRKNVQRYVAMLRLVRCGLLKEAKEVEDVASKSVKVKARKKGSDDDESDSDEDTVVAGLEDFVRKTINQAKKEGRLETQMTEAANSARNQIVRDFMLKIGAPKKCLNCQGITPKYRKDRFVKIFRKPLSEKDRLAMIQLGLKARDPVLDLTKLKKAEETKKRKREAMDEGVADMDGSSAEEEDEGEDVMSRDGSAEPEIADGTMFAEGAAETGAKKSSKSSKEEEYVNPSRVHALLKQMFEREQEILNLVYGGRSQKKGDAINADMFFIQNVLVPPNRYRPEARTGSGQVAEAQENELYKSILNTCDTMGLIQRDLSGKETTTQRQRPRTYAEFENTWINLQDAVNSLIDRDRAPLQGRAGQRNADGIKQKLEKKEGMFRKYMMGKRVNFAARTVISPDPNIETNEIGVPPVFALKLTYPEPVTGHNVEDMQEAVKNGPFVWPGAIAIESEDGRVVSLERKNAEERVALANQLLAPSTNMTGLGSRGTRPKKVHRHLNNGDIVIMNRQPTLHKPSMMCHRAKVLPGEKTLRMHYSNCNTYNADFDGDEMNLHFPQNEVARAEALSIADTDHQYLSSTAGNPLRGLIQDHISMGVWLTNRDSFFDRGEYMQLLYAAVRPESGHSSTGRVETVPPAIFKPKCLWTGKQVITSVLKNIMPEGFQGLTMEGKSTTGGIMWGTEGKDEGNVIVQDGYLCQGILDKKQIGPSSGGFVNGVYEAYGHTVAGRLLSVLGRLLTRMLTTRAFSCGVEDLVFTHEGEAARRDALAGAETVGLDVARKYVSLEDQPDAGNRELRRRLEDVLREDSKQAGLDQLTNNATRELSSAVTDACLPKALIKPFPKNQMQAMTTSGAKGSKVNANQISCNLGQQVLEGRRVPVMVSGKTLPCFKPFETSVRAGGYIVDRFLTGVRPQEYFFHAMAGREGLIDTAVKTSRSGYLQRCLIKGMEGLRVEYDSSVRDTADGSLIQFLYGEDALDVTKAKYLSDFKFAAENYLSLFNSFDSPGDFNKIISDEARDWNREAEKKFRKTNNLGVKDPALAMYNPSTHAGSTSEKMFRAAREYADENPDKLIKDKKKNIEGKAGLSKKNFQTILDFRYLKSVVEAGEAVGVVAGQSVGEPSTQMTLNTFHLAGHSAKNVTLGIPRLREIVMTAASNIATPTMTLKLNEEIGVEEARRFSKGISRLSLAEVVDKISVKERLAAKGRAYSEARTYEVSMDFFPSEESIKEYAITIEDVVATLEHRFLPTLQSMVRKELKKRGEGVETLKQGIGKSAGRVEEETSRPQANRAGGDDDSDGEGDDDATRDKAKNNRQQAGYEAQEDDEEGEMRNRNQREADIEVNGLPEDEGFHGSPRASPSPSSTDDDSDDASDREARKSAAQNRENRIRGEKRTNDVVAFSFDDRTGASCKFNMEYSSSTAKILMLNLVETAAKHALIQSIPGLSLCMVDEDATKKAEDQVPVVVASGVNIRSMWDFQNIIHPHKIYTNSIHDLLLTYGVEAARAGIVLELQGVFGGHGISVDPRHLMLIADYMTRDGVYQAFNRMGYRNASSPLMKMSFETTVGFLRDALLYGEQEPLQGPSAKIVAGTLGAMGTGGFDVLLPVGEGEEEDAEREGEDVEMEGME